LISHSHSRTWHLDSEPWLSQHEPYEDFAAIFRRLDAWEAALAGRWASAWARGWKR
jgi:hypothetical protein